MFQSYLVRGLKAGLVAGLAFGLFVALVANPAIGLTEELAGEHEESGHHEEGIVGHATADAVSVLGGVFLGLLFGVVAFGIAFYFLEPAVPGAGDTKSYLLAAAGFVTVSGAPWLVLPPQPPGVEVALPAGTRLLLYAGAMVAGALACGLAGWAYARLRDRGRTAALAGAAVPFCLLVAGSTLAPATAATATVPAAVTALFRGLVVVGQAALWLILAATHAWLLRRAEDEPAFETGGYEASAAAD